MPAKVLGCPVLRPYQRSHRAAKMRKNNGEIMKMRLSRRTILKGAGALLLAAGSFGFSAFAQTPPAAPGAIEIPPILFAYGHGEHAALWITTLWRMESNGVPRERMFAINFTDPLARTDDTKPEPNKSSTEDHRPELADAIKELKRRTGASRVALVGSSRGGYCIRNYIKNGGGSYRIPPPRVRAPQQQRLGWVSHYPAAGNT